MKQRNKKTGYIRCQFIRKYVNRKKPVRGGDGVIRAGEKQIELVGIFNAASSFN